MKKTFIIILFGLYSITAYCQHRFVLNLKHIATIAFPDTPKVKYAVGDTMYVAATETGVIYLAAATPMQKSIKDMTNPHILDSIYSGIIIGTLKSAHGKVLYKKNILVNNLNGVEFGYSIFIKNRLLYGYNQAFYLNNTLINYGRWSADSLKSNSKELKDFFGTFKLTIDADNARQDNSTEIAYGVGRFIGIGLVIGVIALFGFLIVLIIKKVTK